MCKIDNICEDLENGMFELYYYPQYSLNTQKLVGAETRVCYLDCLGNRHKARSFITTLEKQGQISHLNLWVFRQVCIQQSQWLSKHINLTPITVNISMLTLCDPYSIFDIAMILHEFDLPAKAVRLALTSSAPCTGSYEMEKGISHLKSQGLPFTLNNFGSGFSTLSLLSSKAFDQIILDKTLVSVGLASKRGAIILEAVIRLCDDLSIEVISDGVCSISEAEELKQLGCGFAQGNLYSPPLTDAQFKEYCIN